MAIALFTIDMNTLDTEWEEEFEHLSCSNLLREKDPIYGEENRRAKQQLKTFITTLLTSRDKYWKERVRKAYEQAVQDCRNCYSPDDLAHDWDDKMKALVIDNLK